MDVEDGELVALAVGADGGDGEHFDVLADDGARAGEGGVVIEGDFEPAELLVVVVAVDGDLLDQLVEVSVGRSPWARSPFSSDGEGGGGWLPGAGGEELVEDVEAVVAVGGGGLDVGPDGGEGLGALGGGNVPEILSWIFTIRSDRSARLLVNGTAVSSM